MTTSARDAPQREDTMQTFDHSKKFDFEAHLKEMRQKDEIEARAAGFESVEAYSAHLKAEDEARVAAREQAERAARQRRNRTERTEKLRDQLTEAMADALTSQTVPTSEAWEHVEAWIATKQPAIVLAGNAGVGKTIAAIRALVDWPGSVHFTNASHIGASFEHWSTDAPWIPALKLDTDLLVVDDLGTEAVDGDRRVMPALEKIMNDRQHPSRRTIFTTNLTVSSIAARYSERFRSRLAQACSFPDGFKTITGDDMRRRRRG